MKIKHIATYIGHKKVEVHIIPGIMCLRVARSQKQFKCGAKVGRQAEGHETQKKDLQSG